ncbi:MAG: replicative DNA helicase, partial [Crocinitomicaceae bacterium]
DMVGLLFRTAYYADSQEERDEKDGEAELNLAKNRNGPTGSIPLTFIKELMRFENSTKEIEPG